MGRSGTGGRSRGGGGGGSRGSRGRSSSSGRSGVQRSGSSAGVRCSSYRYRSRYRSYGHGHTHGGTGSVAIAMVWLFIIIVWAIVYSLAKMPAITTSTVNREPLPAGSVQETGYYTDTLSWLGNDTALLNGMKEYYRETGIQPYLYITDEVYGSRDPSAQQMEEFSNALYDELFEDEAHLLLVFQDADGHYTDWVITGSQAKQVADDEAVDILLDYVDRYYYDTSLSESELFGKAFSNTADRMMSKTISPLIYIAGAGVIIVVIVAGVYVFRKKQEQKKREDEQMERFLNMDLKAGEAGLSPEIQDLENKYTSTTPGGN